MLRLWSVFERSACVVGMVVVIQVSSGPASAQSLQDALDMAAVRAPTIGQAEAGLTQAYEERTELGAQRRMRVQLEGSATQRDEVSDVRSQGGVISSSSSRQRRSLGLTVSQTLYTGGRYREAIVVSNTRIRGAEIEVAANQLNAVRNAAAVYSQVVFARESVRISSESISSVSEDLEGSRARFTAGEVSVTDVAQSEARLASSQGAAARARGDLTGAEAAFVRFVGVEPTALSLDMPVANLPATSLDYLVLVADRNLEVAAARLELETAEANVRRAATERNPRVSLEASYEKRWNDAFRGGDSTLGQIGARVTVPMWDGGGTSARVRQSVAQVSGARYALEDALATARATGARAWADYYASLSVLNAAERQLQAAELARRGTKAELRFGLRSTIEALNQEQEYRQARLAVASARNELFVDFIDLMRLMGLDPLGRPAKILDPSRRSVIGPPTIPAPFLIERPADFVREKLETYDVPISEIARGLNQSLEPTRVVGPAP